MHKGCHLHWSLPAPASRVHCSGLQRSAGHAHSCWAVHASSGQACTPASGRPSSEAGAVRSAANGSSTAQAAGSLVQSGAQAQRSSASVIRGKDTVTEFVAETLLPTKAGKFRLRGYRHSVDGGRTFSEPSAVVTGRPEGMAGVPVRVHDACFTSEVLGSLKCDCAEQLALAMRFLQDNPPGIIIYLQQEGRGIGLANKIAAYALQEKGLDTVDANRALGLPDDAREYSSVVAILADLGVTSIQLMTNNPRKIEQLRGLGVAVDTRLPCIVPAGELSAGYLATKRERMAHDFSGQYCYWNHNGSIDVAELSLDDNIL